MQEHTFETAATLGRMQDAQSNAIAQKIALRLARCCIRDASVFGSGDPSAPEKREFTLFVLDFKLYFEAEITRSNFFSFNQKRYGFPALAAEGEIDMLENFAVAQPNVAHRAFRVLTHEQSGAQLVDGGRGHLDGFPVY
jgi:hypothetical protein